MAEFPDPNSGGLDPLSGGLNPGGVPSAKCKAPLWKRVRAWTIIVLLYAVFLGMAAAAIPLLRSAFRPGLLPEDRLLHLLYAVGLLLPFLFVLRYFIRMRLKTGLWRGTPEQRQQERAQRLARCSIDGTKRGYCAAKQGSLFSYAIKWASYTAFQSTCTATQRAAAWLMLAAYTLAVLGVAAIGVICLGASGADDNTRTATLFFVALGVAVLIWPGLVAWKLIRSIRAGKVGTTREELDGLRAQRTAWRMRESAKPLRTKLINTAVAAVIYALLWVRVTVHHAQHPHESWVAPAMAAPFSLYSIWVQFRRPKNAPPTDGHGGGPEMRAQG